jgi:broad specificity phosphatase PhoE
MSIVSVSNNSMKNSCQRYFIVFLFVLLGTSQAISQSKPEKTTIILIRHAEKDTSVAGSTAMQADPPLSDKGLLRAGKLVETLSLYSIDSIFSTNFNRTRTTVIPIANKFGIHILNYDPKTQAQFAEHLKAVHGKTILVVGHSNTIPALVNLLIGTSKYASLADNEYDKIWILNSENGIFTESQIQY